MRNLTIYQTKYFRKLVCLVLICTSYVIVYAQHTDSLQQMRLFMQLCNNYKHLPLYINMTIHNTADITVSPLDDTMFNIEFYIQDAGAFIKMGQDVQVINDSLMLFISNKNRRMTLYPNIGNSGLTEQVNKFTAIFLQDSSVEKFSRKYEVVMPEDITTVAGTGNVKIKSRSLVIGSTMPKETIELVYKKSISQLEKVVDTRYKLMQVDSLTYVKFLQNPVYVNRVLHPSKFLFFVVRQCTLTYMYNEISNTSNMQLPVLMNDCIVKETTGHYIPAKAYESFILTENL